MLLMCENAREYLKNTHTMPPITQFRGVNILMHNNSRLPGRHYIHKLTGYERLCSNRIAMTYSVDDESDCVTAPKNGNVLATTVKSGDSTPVR